MRPSSVAHEPSTRLPPDEKGEIAEACAPTTMQMKSSIGSKPLEAASAGTRGNSAGVTTPSVLENSDMIAATTHIATGTM